jgi:hypothetical protein
LGRTREAKDAKDLFPVNFFYIDRCALTGTPSFGKTTALLRLLEGNIHLI